MQEIWFKDSPDDKHVIHYRDPLEASARIQQLFHDSMCIVLEPLRDAGRNGIEVTGGDGCIHMVHPIIACYVADYPEQCLITCSKYTTCPKCKLDSHDIGQRNPIRKT